MRTLLAYGSPRTTMAGSKQRRSVVDQRRRGRGSGMLETISREAFRERARKSSRLGGESAPPSATDGPSRCLILVRSPGTCQISRHFERFAPVAQRKSDGFLIGTGANRKPKPSRAFPRQLGSIRDPSLGL